MLLAAVTVGSLGFGCNKSSVQSDSAGKEAVKKTKKVGVLMASHGDIDDASKELEDYIKVAFRENVGIPLPAWTRGPITEPAYRLSVDTVRSQYDIIGPTRYRAGAAQQMEAITKALPGLGIRGKAYFGANFAHPYISETLDQMRKDGVTTIVVFNKGAQFSYASSGENMDDVLEYLNEHKDWDVEVLGRYQYSEDERFREVLASGIERDAKTLFPGVPDKDICLLIGSHGLPVWLTDKGDPAIRQMLRVVDWMKVRLAGYKLYHGFLNDDFIPGAKWASPNSEETAQKMRADGCQNVLLDGRLSFTTHHRATLYDLNHVAREIFETPGVQADGKPDSAWVKPKVHLAPNFDGDQAYATLMADLTLETLARVGDFLVLKEDGSAPLARGFVSTPGAFANDFKKYTWPNK